MASILIIDDEVAIATAFAMFFRHDGAHQVTEAHSGRDGIEAYRRLRPDLVLLDVRLPDMTGFEVLDALRDDQPVVIMVTAYGDVPMAVAALHRGAENFLTKPVDLSHLAAAAERGIEKSQLRRLSRWLTSKRGDADGVVFGASPAMRELQAQLQLLSGSDRTTALLLGESGAGKGRTAELVHAQSPRAARPFVAVNCATLRPESLDAELFGVEDNANGVRASLGAFEVADGGTLFLDEIGDLDLALQPKLVRVLEGKGFRRVGGDAEITPNVRVIAASSKDLSSAVAAGRFREDLYYRLAVMPIQLPPLRARAREDLVELVAALHDALATALPGAPTTITDEALDALLRYPWPGNIRELRNVIERAMLVARDLPALDLQHLPQVVRGATGGAVAHHAPHSLAEVERAHIDRTLRAHAHNRTHAARELGISRATLIKKIREYDLVEKSR